MSRGIISKSLLLIASLFATFLVSVPPVAANASPIPARWKDISSPGSGTTCAVSADGQIWCWGKAEGSRGVAWSGVAPEPLTGEWVVPAQVGTATNWIDVEVGKDHACALNSVEEIWCWGDNTNGELGVGNTTASKTPVKVSVPATGWTKVVTGRDMTCGLIAERLYCWGDNTQGDLFSYDGTLASITLPRIHDSNLVLDKVTQVELGSRLCVIVEDGNAMCMIYESSNRSWWTLPKSVGESWTNISVWMSTRTHGSDYKSDGTWTGTRTWTYMSGPLWSTYIMSLPGYVSNGSGNLSGNFATSRDTSEMYSRWDICGVVEGTAKCFNYRDLSKPATLGESTNWENLDIGSDFPYNPVCGTKTDGTVSCVKGWLSGSRGQPTPYYYGFANTTKWQFPDTSTKVSAYLGYRLGAQDAYWESGLIPDYNILDIDVPGTAPVSSIEGSYFTGAMADDPDMTIWGRLFVLDENGIIYGVGDYGRGERLDGSFQNFRTDMAPVLTQTPTFISVSEQYAPKTGGKSLTLNGTYLVGVTSVKFGTTEATEWTESVDGTTLQVTNPAINTSSSVAITIETVGGTVTLNNAVTYATAPAAPAAPAVVDGDASVTVNWSLPSSAGDLAVTGYEVELAPGAKKCSWESGPLSCTFTGLTNGTAYTAKVRAISDVGPGTWSAASASVTPYSVPLTPTITSATPANQKITVTWESNGDGGSPITGWVVSAVPGGAYCEAAAEETSCELTSLQNGTAYTISAYATNARGDGDVYTLASKVTPRTVPGAPVLNSVSPGNGSLTASWSAPVSNGGSAITSYTATASSGASCVAVAPALSCSITGLTNGSVYSVTVVATNAAGSGEASNSRSAYPYTTPGRPTLLGAEPGNGVIDVTWRAPVSNGGSVITGYVARVVETSDTCSASANETTCQISGLINGETYTVSVVATNAAGSGTASTSLVATPRTVPGLARAVSVVRADSALVVSWSAPVDNGGAAIDSYTVTASPSGEYCTVAGDQNTCTITGLTNGSVYSVTVVATNAAGSGAATTAVQGTPATTPGAPASISVTPLDSGATVSWGAASASNGSTITGYRVTTTPASTSCQTNASTFTCDLVGLTNGTSYVFSVSAINSVGAGAAKNSASILVAVAPSQPRSVSVESLDSQLNISWQAPNSTGGVNVSGYEIYLDGVKRGEWTSGDLRYSVSGLVNGREYVVTIKAINAIGASIESSPTRSTPSAKPGKPTNLSATAGNGSVTLRWDAPGNNGGSAITGYEVKANPGDKSCSVTSTSCTISGLTAGTTYVFSLVSKNANGKSDEVLSNSITVTGKPSAVRSAYAVTTKNSIKLIFGVPANTGGLAISSYKAVCVGPKKLTVTSSSPSILIKGLGSKQTYKCQITASNSKGSSSAVTVKAKTK